MQLYSYSHLLCSFSCQIFKIPHFMWNFMLLSLEMGEGNHSVKKNSTTQPTEVICGASFLFCTRISPDVTCSIYSLNHHA